MRCNELLKQQADSVICVEMLDDKNPKYFEEKLKLAHLYMM